MLNPEVAEGPAIEDLQKLLPPGVALLQPSDRREGTERMVGSYRLNLLALSFIAVLVSMYLIYNVTALSGAHRRKDLGILRSLGMLPNQMLQLILWEGLVTVKGTSKGQPVMGQGYVELTGYDPRFAPRL